MKNSVIVRKELVSVLQFSKLHEMPYQAVVRLVKKGVLPVELIGKLTFIDLSKLATIAEEQGKQVHEYVKRRARFTCKRVPGGMC